MGRWGPVAASAGRTASNSTAGRPGRAAMGWRRPAVPSRRPGRAPRAGLVVAGLATLITSLASGSAPPAGITIAVAALVLLGVLLLLRWFWRSARSIGAVVDASERVATGDLAARVGRCARAAAPSSSRARSIRWRHRLETYEARRRELLADIAHELRTPLQAIRGMVDGMLDGLYPADEEHLRPIVERTEVMARLLDDLRTLSTVEAGVLAAASRDRRPARARTAMRSPAARADADAAGVRLETTTAAGVPATVDVDPVRITEVLTNLVENAIAAQPAGRAGLGRARGRRARLAVRFDVTRPGPRHPPGHGGARVQAVRHVGRPRRDRPRAGDRQATRRGARRHARRGLDVADRDDDALGPADRQGTLALIATPWPRSARRCARR